MPRPVSDDDLRRTLQLVQNIGRRQAAVALDVSYQTVGNRIKMARDRSIALPSTDPKALVFSTSDAPAPTHETQPLHATRLRAHIKPQVADEAAAGLWKKYLNGNRRDTDLRKQLADHYLFLIDQVVLTLKRSLPQHVLHAELRGAGLVGLVDATSRFDPARGYTFSAFATPRIRGAILDQLRDDDILPRSVRKVHATTNAVKENLTKELGHAPTDAELREALPAMQSEFFRTCQQAQQPQSLDRAMLVYPDGSEFSIAEVLIAQQPDPSARLRNKQLSNALLRGLMPDEFVMLYLYYFREKTMKFIGEVLDLSESRVSQLHSSVISRLQKCRSLEDVEGLM